jgi:HSP20 family protein
MLLAPERLTARVFATRETGARLDAYREDGTFFIDIDLPGAGPAAIDITVDGKMLTLRVERKRGASTRQVQLSEKLDTDQIEARYDDGALTMRIPVLGVSARTEAS